jgi:hypothetical protein
MITEQGKRLAGKNIFLELTRETQHYKGPQRYVPFKASFQTAREAFEGWTPLQQIPLLFCGLLGYTNNDILLFSLAGLFFDVYPSMLKRKRS